MRYPLLPSLGSLVAAALAVAAAPAPAQYLPPQPGLCGSGFTYSARMCVPRSGVGLAYEPPQPGLCAMGYTYSALMCVPKQGGAINAYRPPMQGLCAMGLFCRHVRAKALVGCQLCRLFLLARQTHLMGSTADWDSFEAALFALLADADADLSEEELMARVEQCLQLCPSGLGPVEPTRAIMQRVNDSHPEDLLSLLDAVTGIDPYKALPFVGMADLSDDPDEVLESLLDAIDENSSLDHLARFHCPASCFEVNALLTLITWPELPDWARALLVVRDNIGLTTSDRDSVMQYLGNSTILEADTICALASDLARDRSRYSAEAQQAFSDFINGDFEAVSAFSGLDSEAIAEHFSELSDSQVQQCRQALG